MIETKKETTNNELFINNVEFKKGLKYLLMKYLNPEVTATKIIFKYAVWFNETNIKPVSSNNKKLYLKLVETFIKELNTIRINEARDIYNPEDIKKIKKIAEICYLKRGIISYIYTAAGANYKKYQTIYLKINISGSDYTAVSNITNKNSINKLVCCGDCSFCLWCKHEFNIEIVNKYHGSSIPENTGDDKRTAGVKYYHKYVRLLCWYKYQHIKQYN